MDLFAGSKHKIEEPVGPVFTKPFSDGGVAIQALSEKLAEAPPQSKFIFRDALESIREKAKRHGSISQLLAECGQPMLVLYDVQVVSRAGSARIDFVILAPGYILALSCPEKSSRMISDDSTELERRAPYPGDFNSEEKANILAESLSASRHLPGKAVRNVWPVRILSEEEEQQSLSEGRAFSSTFSRMYPEIRSAQVISRKELHGLLEALSGPDYVSFECPVKKLYAMSDHLMNYDTQVTGCPVPYRTGTEKTPECRGIESTRRIRNGTSQDG